MQSMVRDDVRTFLGAALLTATLLVAAGPVGAIVLEGAAANGLLAAISRSIATPVVGGALELGLSAAGGVAGVVWTRRKR